MRPRASRRRGREPPRAAPRSSAGAQLYIEARPKPPEGVAWMMPAAAIGMIERPVRSPQWRRYGVAIEVPQDAHTIVIGMALAGSGAAWFGDLELE